MGWQTKSAAEIFPIQHSKLTNGLAQANEDNALTALTLAIQTIAGASVHNNIPLLNTAISPINNKVHNNQTPPDSSLRIQVNP